MLESINGFDLNILVDTGATLSLVAKRVYDRLLKSNSSFESLREVSQPVLSAKNDPLTIYGKLSVPIFIIMFVITCITLKLLSLS